MPVFGVLEVLSFLAGVLIVLGTIGSAIRTLVLPRAVASRLSVFVGRRLVYRTLLKLSYRLDSYESKDRLLAYGAPLSLLAVLASWMLAFLVGFALLIWPFTHATFLQSLRESGSSLLTLGFAQQNRVGPTIMYLLAGFTGLVIVALQIAYLPVLYGAFNRRETLVTMLQSRAGAPAWGPEILARAQLVNITDELRHLYAEWERWSAEVMESHTTYPVLIWFRSPHPLRSWIVGLLSALDSAAMFHALAPSTAPPEARLFLRMGFTCLRSIADVLGISYDPDPLPVDPIELTFEEFASALQRLEESGFPVERSAEEAWPHFKGWRVNYESIAYRLADVVVAPPGPWSGPRTHLPNLAIVPQRPVNRTPEDPQVKEEKAGRSGWHA